MATSNNDPPMESAPADVVVEENVKPEYYAQVSALSDLETPSAPATPSPLNAMSTVQLPPETSLFPPRPSSTSVPREMSDGGGGGGGASVKTSVTFGGQVELTPLPIPSLEETLSKFMKCIEALQADDDERTRGQSQKVVMDFLEQDGPLLQHLLLEYDRVGRETGEIGSYVEEFWNDSYLAPDSSVVLNLNPFFVLEDSPDPKIAKDPVKRAASLCFASVKLASQLRFEALKPDTFKGKPLCMDQFKALFATARVPMRNDKDAIHVFEKSNHLAVLCQGKIYYFQALWPDGNVAVDEGDIVDILTAIQAHAHDDDDDLTRAQQWIGVLTSLPRNEWAMAREELIQHSVKNEESLKIIDSALFVLVLDDYIPQSKHDAAANMLHGSYLLKQLSVDGCDSETGGGAGGGGVASVSNPSSPRTTTPLAPSNDWLMFSDYQAGSCCNRWYDKMQIIVCGDGTAGINFEHSAIDGHTALRFVSDVYAETVLSFAQSITKLVAAHDMIPHVISAKVRRAATALDAQGRATLDVFPKKLHFEIPEAVQRKIYYAETALGDEIVASETFVLEFKDYGKSFITSNKLSPDSFIQMSMMLAYYKLYGRIVCSYEPVLTKNFYHGRTEAMRPATMEARRLCQLFVDSRASVSEKIAALRDATNVHSQLVKECSQGKGVDRHLFALKCIAEKNGLPVPPFFHSRPWKLLNHTVLSTSNCGNPALAGFGFGPVVPDGLGIGYIIKDHSLHYSISSKHRQTRRYAYTLEATLRDMAKLFTCTQTKNSADAALRAASAQQRQKLKNIPLDMISYDSYGDIWGESSSPQPRMTSDPRSESSVATKPKHRWSAEMQLSSHIVQEEVMAEQGVSKDDAGSDDDVFELKLQDSDAPSQGNGPSNTTGGASAPPDRVRLKRRGSKDSIPVQPGRRGGSAVFETSDRSLSHNPRETSASADNSRESQGRSENRMVGPVQRQPSFEYAELSQKGLKIEMDLAGR